MLVGQIIYFREVLISETVFKGSSTGFDYGVAFEFCNEKSNECCKTNYLDIIFYDELVAGSSLLYDLPGTHNLIPCIQQNVLKT